MDLNMLNDQLAGLKPRGDTFWVGINNQEGFFDARESAVLVNPGKKVLSLVNSCVKTIQYSLGFRYEITVEATVETYTEAFEKIEPSIRACNTRNEHQKTGNMLFKEYNYQVRIRYSRGKLGINFDFYQLLYAGMSL